VLQYYATVTCLVLYGLVIAAFVIMGLVVKAYSPVVGWVAVGFTATFGEEDCLASCSIVFCAPPNEAFEGRDYRRDISNYTAGRLILHFCVLVLFVRTRLEKCWISCISPLVKRTRSYRMYLNLAAEIGCHATHHEAYHLRTPPVADAVEQLRSFCVKRLQCLPDRIYKLSFILDAKSKFQALPYKCR
jgi:hypothetical protein